MYHINNNAFSCVLKVVRLQSDICNAVGKLFHTANPLLFAVHFTDTRTASKAARVLQALNYNAKQ